MQSVERFGNTSMRDVDVQRLIEMLENSLRVHPDKGYEIGTVEEAEKFAKLRQMKGGDPVKHCEVYRGIGCTHVDGYLCDMETCDIRQKFLLEKNSGVLGSPRK